jgi:hypothetical protein
MNKLTRKRKAFRPLLAEASLEDRLVLSSGATAGPDSTTNPLVTVVMPVTQPGVTPPPASPPVNPRVIAAHRLTVAHLRAAYARQVRAAVKDLRTAIRADVNQLRASGSTPTAQQLTDFNARVSGAIDATALRLSSQAALLPNASTRLIPAIQNALLGSGPKRLTSSLSSLAQSGRLINGSVGAVQSAIARQINLAGRQATTLLSNYFSTTPLNRLSVNSSGQRIPLAQFLGGQLLNQVGNTLGILAQSFPTVANAMLFPNGATGTPSQSALNAFATQVSNALATSAFQLGSALALFPGSSTVIAQLQPMLSGAANSTSTNSLVSALQALQFGGTGFNTAVATAFNNAFQNFATPLGSFFQTTGLSNLTLPTSGFTSPFGSLFSGSSFNNGFNNGFATSTNIGFIGFGQAPSAFNTNFGTGFNNLVSTVNQNMGFSPVNPVFSSGGTGVTPTSGGTGVTPTSGGTGVTPTSGGTGVTPTSGGTGGTGGSVG